MHKLVQSSVSANVNQVYFDNVREASLQARMKVVGVMLQTGLRVANERADTFSIRFSKNVLMARATAFPFEDIKTCSFSKISTSALRRHYQRRNVLSFSQHLRRLKALLRTLGREKRTA